MIKRIEDEQIAYKNGNFEVPESRLQKIDCDEEKYNHRLKKMKVITQIERSEGILLNLRSSLNLETL